jgi:cytochrome P450/surfactin synthase thioesterase subunit
VNGAAETSKPDARVFCLPYAGGSSVAYRRWRNLGERVEVVAVDYPGHLLRPDEPALESVQEIVADLAARLAPLWDAPFVICGASLGALVAFELARSAEALGRRPLAVVLAACAAPSRLPKHASIADLDDEAFIRSVENRYGTVGVSLGSDPDVAQIVLPALRADIAVFERYAATSPDAITSDILAIAGQDDGSVSYGEIAAWQEFTSGTARPLSVPGGHFFVETDPHPVVGEIRELIARALSGAEQEAARCPVATYPMKRDDPFEPPPEYAGLRERGPVVRARLTFNGGRDVWLVTRYEEAKAVLTDTRFSSDSRNPGFPVRRTPSALIRMDPPEHTYYRRMLQPEFVGRQVAGLRPVIQKLTDELLDAVVASPGPVDLVPQLAMPLPSLVICHLLGVPYRDHVFLQERTAVALGNSATAEQVDEAIADLGRYMDDVVREKASKPGDDMVSRLVHEQVRTGECTEETASDLARLLLVAGHVTTVNMIGLGILTLLQHPDQLERLREDPALIGSAVNELLRYLSITPTVSRVATEDIEVGGTRIRRGDGVMVLLSSGNRDERAFADPDLFDIGRGERGNLAFGHGPHLCLGAALARLELQIVISTVLRRLPGLRHSISVEEIPFRHGVMIYGVYQLLVDWDR